MPKNDKQFVAFPIFFLGSGLRHCGESWPQSEIDPALS